MGSTTLDGVAFRSSFSAAFVVVSADVSAPGLRGFAISSHLTIFGPCSCSGFYDLHGLCVLTFSGDMLQISYFC